MNLIKSVDVVIGKRRELKMCCKCRKTFEEAPYTCDGIIYGDDKVVPESLVKYLAEEGFKINIETAKRFVETGDMTLFNETEQKKLDEIHRNIVIQLTGRYLDNSYLDYEFLEALMCEDAIETELEELGPCNGTSFKNHINWVHN